MTYRDNCLLDNEKLSSAVSVFVEELKEDNFECNLKACTECKAGMDKQKAINIHCQLKSIYENLSKIVLELECLEQIS